MKRKHLFIITIIFVICLSQVSFAASTYDVTINGDSIDLTGVAPFYNNEYMVPVRALCESLGGYVWWEAESKMVEITYGEKTVYIGQGSDVIAINGSEDTLDSEVVNIEGRTYASSDIIQKIFGLVYNVSGNIIDISIKQLENHYTDSFSISYICNDTVIIDGEGREHIIANNAMKDIVLASTTQGPAFDNLDAVDSIMGVTDPEIWWTIKSIKEGMQNGSIEYVGGQWPNADYEKLVVLDPEMIFVYTGTYGQVEMIQKFEELNLPYAVDNDYLETHPVGCSEWIKFVGAFVGKEFEAERLVNKTIKEINDITEAIKDEAKPKIAWANIYNGQISVPGGASYVSKMIDLAGGQYICDEIYPDATGAQYITMEAFYGMAKDADIFILSNSISYIANPTITGLIEENPILAEIKAIKQSNVWCYDDAWFQLNYNPEIIINDLASIFHPGIIEDDGLDSIVEFQD